MNEVEARQVAAQIADRWPGYIQARVDAPSTRTDELGYVVRLAIPRENRLLRLARSSELDGILSVCSALLDTDPGAPALVPVAEEEEEKDTNMNMNMDREPTEQTPSADRPVLFREHDLLHPGEQERKRGRRPRTPQEAALALPATKVELAASGSEETTCQAHDPIAVEAQILRALIAHAFAQVPGIVGLGRLTEVPRSWKVDVTTTRGPESYRVTRHVDGSFRQECWQ